MHRATTRSSLILLATLLAGCATPDAASGTCERREECGNLAGATVAECRDTEQTRLDRLEGDARSSCEAAIAACLEGEVCDDFRACQADIDSTVCPCPDPTVTILSPTDGQTLGAADDADPSDAQLQFDFVFETVCFEELEQVELLLLAPVESSYGFGTPDGAGRVTIRVPLIPGENRFAARGTVGTARSAELTVTVTP